MKINIVNIIVQTGIGVVLAGSIWVIDSRAEARADKLESFNIIQNNELRDMIVKDIKSQYIYSLSDVVDLIKTKSEETKVFIESQDKKLNNNLTRKLDERERKYATMYYEDQEGRLYYLWVEQFPDSLVIIKSIEVKNNFDQ